MPNKQQNKDKDRDERNHQDESPEERAGHYHGRQGAEPYGDLPRLTEQAMTPGSTTSAPSDRFRGAPARVVDWGEAKKSGRPGWWRRRGARGATPLWDQARAAGLGIPENDSMKIERAIRVANGDPDDETCICGCGLYPKRRGSKFLSGHDSKLRSLAIQVDEGEIPVELIPRRGRNYLWPDGNYPDARFAKNHPADTDIEWIDEDALEGLGGPASDEDIERAAEVPVHEAVIAMQRFRDEINGQVSEGRVESQAEYDTGLAAEVEEEMEEAREEEEEAPRMAARGRQEQKPKK